MKFFKRSSRKSREGYEEIPSGKETLTKISESTDPHKKLQITNFFREVDKVIGTSGNPREGYQEIPDATHLH